MFTVVIKPVLERLFVYELEWNAISLLKFRKMLDQVFEVQRGCWIVNS